MTIWIGAQLSPRLAAWIEERFGVHACAVREAGLRDAPDISIFGAAREADVVVLTKDADFPHLLSQHGPPPRVLWVTCGNTSDTKLQAILDRTLPEALRLLESGEALVEVADATIE